MFYLGWLLFDDVGADPPYGVGDGCELGLGVACGGNSVRIAGLVNVRCGGDCRYAVVKSCCWAVCEFGAGPDPFGVVVCECSSRVAKR